MYKWVRKVTFFQICLKTQGIGLRFDNKSAFFSVISDEASKCERQELYKDGLCDDVNNNAGCYYDGGDCCGCPGEVKAGTCSRCLCFDPDYKPDCLD